MKSALECGFSGRPGSSRSSVFRIPKPFLIEFITASNASAGEYLLDVQASGPWTITMEQPRPESAPQTTSFNGAGKTATDFFQLSQGLTRFEMRHQGQRNFIVNLLDENGASVGMTLVNEIGPFQGSKAVQVPRDGIYLLQVEADGPWAIELS